MTRKSTFICGELVDLCSPDTSEITIDKWFRWFNDKSITKYLHQGVFPNTYQEQLKFVNDTLNDKHRILTLITKKNSNKYIGVCSLSNINYRTLECHFSLIAAEKSNMPFLGSLEAKSLLTQHAFEVLGMKRIYSDQSIELRKWQMIQILLGYQLEGIKRSNFRKGMFVSDSYFSSCILEDYLHIKELRNGSYWPGRRKMMKLISQLPKNSHLDEVEIYLRDKWSKVLKDTIFI